MPAVRLYGLAGAAVRGAIQCLSARLREAYDHVTLPEEG